MKRSAIAAICILSAAAFFASPSPQYAAESDCGANSGNKCWQTESCANFIFFRMCTTKFKYYKLGDDNGAPRDHEVI